MHSHRPCGVRSTVHWHPRYYFDFFLYHCPVCVCACVLFVY